jgi:peroxiredoxin
MNRIASRSLAPVLGLVAALASAAPAHAAPLALGQKAPEATTVMETTDGKKLTLAGVAGKKGTLVFFTCNHCPYAKAWEKRIAAIGNAAQKEGFGVVAINPNDPKKVPDDDLGPMKERAKALGLEFPYAVDATSGIARAFGATKTPEVFLFDAKGVLVYSGAVDDSSEDEAKVKKPYLRDALAAVAAGKAPSPAETKAIGCSIKLRE